MASLVNLPAELIQHILSYLSAPDLVCISSTCRILLDHGKNSILWTNLVNDNLPVKIKDPGPFGDFRSLYIAHHPYWFVPRNRIWFSDAEHTGKMIVARYDNRRGVIEGFRLVAERGPETIEEWEWNPNVAIQSFNPRVRLWLDDPVIQLKNPLCEPPHRRQYLPNELRMPMTAESQQVYSSFLLCPDDTPKASIRPDQLWPPITIPSEKRVVRGDYSIDHGSEDLEQSTIKSESAFRIRKWAHFRLGVPIFPTDDRENISTFATLDSSLYTPTKEKPYQGIWVGDYTFHGCEFLLFLQRDKDDVPEDLATAGDQTTLFENENSDHGSIYDFLDGEFPPDENHTSVTQDNNDFVDDTTDHGRLEGIKLTGDPNVPRGEVSFVAEDIGRGGLLRIANDDRFKNARVVRSKGHIASRNFRHGKSCM
jgi:hypothetical protein